MQLLLGTSVVISVVWMKIFIVIVVFILWREGLEKQEVMIGIIMVMITLSREEEGVVVVLAAMSLKRGKWSW